MRRTPASSRLAGALIAVSLITACGQDKAPDGAPAVETRASVLAAGPGSQPREAGTLLDRLRSRPGLLPPAGANPTFERIAGGLSPRFAAAERVTARVVLSDESLSATRVEDAWSGVSVDVSLADALIADAEVVDGYVVYEKAHVSGATLLHRALPEGMEDFLAFDQAPRASSVAYKVALGSGVKGLRLVARTLEMLDAHGAPRLRVSPPYIVGADGARTDAALAVEGCAVDTNPAGPWGRRVTAPGAKTCTVRVSWPGDSVKYPAVLDPRWTVTASMATARQDHVAILLPLTGKVLVVGGRSSPTGTTGLATAELYDKATNTWGTTNSIGGGGRWSHRATLLNSSTNATTSQKVLVAGGINGTASSTSAQLYSQTAGTWAAAGIMNAARHLHSATLLADGRVLVAGGMNGTTTLQSAALYNPASGSGSWTATTGPIPPPALKNHTATLLVTSNQQLANKVLFVGGNSGSATLTSVFLFDPVQSAFSTLLALSTPREGHTATVLANGKILIAGGKNGSTPLATALTFDPSSSNGVWASAGSMSAARVGHSASLLTTAVLTSGQVLVAGGSNASGTLASTDMYKVATNSWAADAPMVAPVQGHAAVALGNSVLISGGANGATTVSASELYDPSSALSCTSGSQCASGFCVNSVCCDTACNQGCGACNLPGKVGICSPIANGTACADDGLPCTRDQCNGTSVACQHPAGNAGTVCRPPGGDCDVAEACNGTSTTCPTPDAKKGSGVACPDDGLPCTRDQCNGTSNECQHPAGNAGTECRGLGGPCDAVEVCTGTSTSCPPDVFSPSSTVCRPAAPFCDIAENCIGTSAACPPDAFAPPSTVCRPAAGACDVAENCPGNVAACPADGKVADGTACNDGNGCTQTDSCQAGVCTGSNPVTCTAQNQCRTAGTCDPATGACSNPARNDGIICDDGDPCTQADSCRGGQCAGVGGLGCTQGAFEGVSFCPNAPGGSDPATRGWWRQ